MKPFQFVQPPTLDDALRSADGTRSMWLAGGTTLVDLMKLNVLTPTKVVSIKPLLDATIEQRDGRIYLGAGCTMAAVADHALIKQHLPVIRQSLILAASPQIRNMATIAGNLLQRTRSPYFRHIDFPQHVSGEAVKGSLEKAQSEGVDISSMAVLGNKGQLLGTYPGDFGVAFAALNGTVHVRGPGGDRTVAAREFFVLPTATAAYTSVLKTDELIVGLSVAPAPAAAHSLYLKIRDRSSYAFALASAAVGLQLEGQGSGAKIVDAHIGLGGSASVPWPSPQAESILRSRPATDAVFRDAAEAAFAGAQPPDGLQWKVTLGKRVLMRALQWLRDQGVPADREIWAYQHGRA